MFCLVTVHSGSKHKLGEGGTECAIPHSVPPSPSECLEHRLPPGEYKAHGGGKSEASLDITCLLPSRLHIQGINLCTLVVKKHAWNAKRLAFVPCL